MEKRRSKSFCLSDSPILRFFLFSPTGPRAAGQWHDLFLFLP
jgi:hypothetical protein